MHYNDPEKKKSIPIGSINSKRFKSKALLCANCNNSLTQPYDKAWEKLYSYLEENWKKLESAGVVNLERVFPGETRRKMLCVHLYFLKLFGCRVQENNVPIPVEPIAESIKRRKAHKNFYLCIGQTLGSDGSEYSGLTEIYAWPRGNSVAVANWFYTVGEVSVQLIYSIIGVKHARIGNAWHPRDIKRTLKLSKYQS